MPKPINERPSRAAIEAALSFLPAQDRDLWLKVGMGLKAELGDEGYSMFDTWSQSAENYQLNAVKSVWKGFKAVGKVSIGTVIFEAKQRGFNPKEYAPATPMSAEEIAAKKAEKALRDALEREEIDTAQNAAAEQAQKLWSESKPSGHSAYLEKKKITLTDTHGIRFTKAKGGDAVLVPMLDAAGKLCNLQRIFPNGDKRFFTGGKVSGCAHVIGNAVASPWLLIAEGYATAATLHAATGYAVVIAFSASNLKHIAKIMRERYPQKPILLCADDDSENEAKTGKNTGVVAATEAAQMIAALWCKPMGLQNGGNDFNDLMQAAGIGEIKKQIEAAISKARSNAPHQADAAPVSNADAPHIQHTQNAGMLNVRPADIKDKAQRQNNARKPSGEGQSLKPFFVNRDDGSGVFYQAFHEGEALPALKICSSLDVIAKTRDAASNEWGYLLEFPDPDGNKKRWSMPAKMLSGDGTQYRADLLSMGLLIEPGLKAKNHLTTYIQTADVPSRVRCVDRIGWHGDVYVLPDRTIGESDETILFQSAGGAISPFKQRGVLADWQTHVSAYCRGNSRLLFFVSAGFASLLLHHAKMQSFGLHLMGSSSTGKSTAMKVAASIFGGNDYAQSWHVTDNSLEATAQKHCDALLVLDELGQADPKMVGYIAYMLANEKGKGRATQHATAKKIATWRVLFLSDGEISLETKMAEAGKAIKGGQEVRLAHINADAGQGLGLFDTVHGFAGGAAMSKYLVDMAQTHYGTAGLAFIEWLVENIANLPSVLSEAINATTDKLCPPNAHGQVKRVADFFSLVAAGGELATGAGITGWADGEATEAATRCFNDWLSNRGTSGDVEHMQMLRLLPDFIDMQGDRFTWATRALDDRAAKSFNRAGFRRLLSKSGAVIDTDEEHHKEYGDKMHANDAEETTVEYYVYLEVFNKEICKGFNAKDVTKLMVDRGVFEAAKNKDINHRMRFGGVQSRYYKISSKKLDELNA
jgi:putative DNA primase/helicase